MFTIENTKKSNKPRFNKRGSSRFTISQDRKVTLIATTPDEKHIHIQLENYSSTGLGGFCASSEDQKNLLSFYAASGLIFPEAEISYSGETLSIGRIVLRTSLTHSEHPAAKADAPVYLGFEIINRKINEGIL